MANNFFQIYIQAVFAVQGRQWLIRKENKEELHKYMTGITYIENQEDHHGTMTFRLERRQS